jgi:uncharacterized membrane protein YfcA
VCLLGSALTFFSGFGLGTLLLPAFGLFFPLETAIGLTAVVHLLSNAFKAGLSGRHAEWKVVARFGIPSLIASFAGAWLLISMSSQRVLIEYEAGGFHAIVTPLKLIIGLLMLCFVAMDLFPERLSPRLKGNHELAGGLVSGFFGGLTGMQGALRSAFLIHAELTKEAFIATGVMIACLVDVARLIVYAERMGPATDTGNLPLLAVSCAAAFAGAYSGNRMLKKVTYRTVQRIVATLLAVFAALLILGIL